jgi:hypothetical protein
MVGGRKPANWVAVAGGVGLKQRKAATTKKKKTKKKRTVFDDGSICVIDDEERGSAASGGGGGGREAMAAYAASCGCDGGAGDNDEFVGRDGAGGVVGWMRRNRTEMVSE